MIILPSPLLKWVPEPWVASGTHLCQQLLFLNLLWLTKPSSAWLICSVCKYIHSAYWVLQTCELFHLLDFALLPFDTLLVKCNFLNAIVFSLYPRYQDEFSCCPLRKKIESVISQLKKKERNENKTVTISDYKPEEKIHTWGVGLFIGQNIK